MVAKVVGELNVDGVLWGGERGALAERSSGNETAAVHGVEQELFRNVWNRGRLLFGTFLSGVGNGDHGAEDIVSNTSASAAADPG